MRSRLDHHPDTGQRREHADGDAERDIGADGDTDAADLKRADRRSGVDLDSRPPWPRAGAGLPFEGQVKR